MLLKPPELTLKTCGNSREISNLDFFKLLAVLKNQQGETLAQNEGNSRDISHFSPKSMFKTGGNSREISNLNFFKLRGKLARNFKFGCFSSFWLEIELCFWNHQNSLSKDGELLRNFKFGCFSSLWLEIEICFSNHQHTLSKRGETVAKFQI